MRAEPQREVWLLRHAKARSPVPGQADIERALSDRGMDQCRQISDWLQPRLAATTFRLLVSPARRTRQTARNVFGSWCPNEAITTDEIWNASAAGLLQVIESQPGNLVIVGHNPGLEQLQYALTGQLRPLPTGGVFRLGMLPGPGRQAELMESFQPVRDST
ncbi:MAG: SixA phosphatase family protein [Wenzhouxiangellaceae bacterium]